MDARTRPRLPVVPGGDARAAKLPVPGAEYLVAIIAEAFPQPNFDEIRHLHGITSLDPALSYALTPHQK